MKWRVIREITLFIGGLLVILYETVIEATDRATIIIAALTMMGLPLVSSLDRARENTKDDSSTADKSGRRSNE